MYVKRGLLVYLSLKYIILIYIIRIINAAFQDVFCLIIPSLCTETANQYLRRCYVFFKLFYIYTEYGLAANL